MSYARWSKSSDVYVYLDVAGFLNCCGCDLGEIAVGATAESRFTTTTAMLEHLDEHVAAGHLVPGHCVEELKADADENDAWLRAHK